MVQSISLTNSGDSRDVIHQIVERLAQGGLVALPSETGYVVAGVSSNSKSLAGLKRWADQSKSKYHAPLFCLIFGHKHEAEDYLFDEDPLSYKLAFRCWPGPMEIIVQPHLINSRTSLMSVLPRELQDFFEGNSYFTLACSQHKTLQLVRQMLNAPLVGFRPLINDPSSVTGLTCKPLYDSATISKFVGEEPILVVEDAPSRFLQSPTLISTKHNKIEIVVNGAISETSINRIAGEYFLFVCTGNTCRSPMAEGYFRHYLAEKLSCKPDELLDKGFIVSSAGLSTMNGYPASQEAIDYLAELSIDISMHSSKMMTHEMLDQADRIYTMTKGHLSSILSQRPDLTSKVSLISPQGTDIADPIGGSAEEYEECAKQIEQCVKHILENNT